MTDGKIVYEAPGPDRCYPYCKPPAAWAHGDGEIVTYHYPGTVWKCGCGRVWVVGDGNEWEPEGWWQRRRRLRRARRAERRQTTVGGWPSSSRLAVDLGPPPRWSAIVGPLPSGVSVCPPVSAPKDVLPPSAAVTPEEDGTDG